ncbi:STAS domain-containing protein [Gemmata sp. G18]|uniref:STAS domain-containing protein n=1 Tax=Gemmata palustris TaxID=2822762 RepID=A0ABS5BSN6_9BACT|nr:STAS domain-containing protein [Gemmata palustris]MBP3956731.1 STAS domain-containing protein [Gemmata palustris]
MNETAAGPDTEGKGNAPYGITLGESLELAEISEFLVTARAASDSESGVRVDCSAPAFLPTGAVQILIALQRACRERGHPFVVEGIQESAVAYLRLAGLDAILRS